MKYCKNCGMLLEDSHEYCIGCGTDVTDKDNVSKYPPQVQQNLESQKKENKARTGIVGAIIVVFVLLLVLMGVIVFQASEMSGNPKEGAEQEESSGPSGKENIKAETADALLDGSAEDLENTKQGAEAVSGEDREINDDLGSYYIYTEVSDADGSVIFSSVYPEDFTNAEPSIDYGKYSTKFPEAMTFVTGNEDNTVRFTYMSPQQFWYKNSETGRTRSNERDGKTYMSYLTYGGAQGYIDALIRQGYSDAKKVTLVETVSADEELTRRLEKLSADYTMTLLGDIGDYARIGKDTTYATGESEFAVDLLKYEITTRYDNTLYCEFYVPLIANHFYYANDRLDDRGTVTEWICLSVIGFEAGNEELYHQFEDAFFVFMENTKVNRMFYGINMLYGKEIAAALEKEETPPKLTAQKVEDYTAQGSLELDAFYADIQEFSEMTGASNRVFDLGDLAVTALEDTKAVFYDQSAKKVFITPGKGEYPGDSYTELTAR
ncbi:MAG: hypothetical protein QM697_15685 [Lachnospiraceae bacterium]